MDYDSVILAVGFDADLSDSSLKLFGLHDNQLLLLDYSNKVTMPSSFYYNRKNKLLFVADEKNHKRAAIHVFSISNNKLLYAQRTKTLTSNPCFITVDKDESSLYICNYTYGGLSRIDFEKTGLLNTNTITYFEKNKCCHCCIPEKSFISVFFTSDNYISILRNDTFDPCVLVHIDSPRQGVYSQKHDKMYILSEKTSKVSVCDMQQNRIIKEYSTTKYANITNTTSSILMTKDETVLIISNRGCDSIIKYSIGNDGLLYDFNVLYEANGKCPRDIDYLEDNNLLAIAFRDSDYIEILRIDNTFSCISNVARYNTPAPIGIKFLK